MKKQCNAGEKEGRADIVAWISVHDTIDGPKLRDLYKNLKCSKYEATGILVLLWQWGLFNADKDGQILHADREDIADYLLGKSTGCKNSPEKIVEALIETGWIEKREDGTMYFHDWAEWQKEWYKYQDRKIRDKERKSTAKEEQRPVIINMPEPVPVKEPAAEVKKPEKKRTSIDYSDEFLRFWKVYPRQDNKSEAYKSFMARIKEGVPADELILAATNYAAECRKRHTEKQFTMQAKTFLGPNIRFKDFVEEKNGTEDTAIYDDRFGNPFADYE